MNNPISEEDVWILEDDAMKGANDFREVYQEEKAKYDAEILSTKQKSKRITILSLLTCLFVS